MALRTFTAVAPVEAVLLLDPLTFELEKQLPISSKTNKNPIFSSSQRDWKIQNHYINKEKLAETIHMQGEKEKEESNEYIMPDNNEIIGGKFGAGGRKKGRRWLWRWWSNQIFWKKEKTRSPGCWAKGVQCNQPLPPSPNPQFLLLLFFSLFLCTSFELFFAFLFLPFPLILCN